MNLKAGGLTLFTILMALSSTLYAGQNDYDGTWNVDISCSINSNNQMPGFAYSEVWSIKNDAISHTSNKKTKQGDEQTAWNGKISNKILTINAEGNNGNTQRPWLWIGSGSITGDDLFQINADMIGRIGKKVRDCVLKFSSLDPAVGSLAYLKTHPQPAIKSEPTKPKLTTEGNNTKLPPKPLELKEVKESKPTDLLDKVAAKSEAPTKASMEPMNTNTTDLGKLFYILGGAGIILVGGGVFTFVRRRKDDLPNKTVELIKKSKEEFENKELLLAKKAQELEVEQLRLQEAKNEIETKEALAVKNAQLLKEQAEKEVASLRKRVEEELATARAMKEAAMLKRQAEEELAKAESMRKTNEANARLALAEAAALKRESEASAKMALEKQRAEVALAKAQALKEAEERKRKADDEYERLKHLTESQSPSAEFSPMKCISCGTEMKMNAKFCNKCGAKRH